MTKILRAAVVALGALLFSAACGAAYPERPITLICPWAAGGGTDATARIIGNSCIVLNLLLQGVHGRDFVHVRPNPEH